jgi:hypothetical protein
MRPKQISKETIRWVVRIASKRGKKNREAGLIDPREVPGVTGRLLTEHALWEPSLKWPPHWHLTAKGWAVHDGYVAGLGAKD